MNLLHCLLLGCGLLPSLAMALPPQAGSPPSHQAAQLAADAQASVPDVAYASAFSAYAPAAARKEAPDQLWLENNRALAASGGMAGMAHMPAARVPAQPGAKPASQPVIKPPAKPLAKPPAKPTAKPAAEAEPKAEAGMSHPMEMPMDHMHHQGM